MSLLQTTGAGPDRGAVARRASVASNFSDLELPRSSSMVKTVVRRWHLAGCTGISAPSGLVVYDSSMMSLGPDGQSK